MFVEEEKKNNINNDVNDNSKVRHIQKKNHTNFFTSKITIKLTNDY